MPQLSPDTVRRRRRPRLPTLLQRRESRDFGWSTGSSVASSAAGFVSTVVVARLLTVDEFAIYLVLVTISVIAATVADAGFFALVTRESSRGEQPMALTAAAARQRLPLWIAILALLQLSAVVGLFPYGLALTAAAVAAISQAQVDTAFGELSARGRFAAGAALRLFSSITSLLMTVLLSVVFHSYLAAIAGFALGRLAPALVSSLHRSWPSAAPSLRWGAALTLGMTGVLISLYVRNDLLLLSLFHVPSADLARYGIAYGILAALQLVPASLAFVAFTRFAPTPGGSSPAPAAPVLCVSYAIGACIAALIYLYPPLVFRAFGSGYAHGIATVEPLLLLVVPISIGQPALSMLQARNRERQGLWLILGTMTINIGLNLALIPLLGARGAVLGTTIAEFFVASGAVTLLAAGGFGDMRLPAIVGIAVPLALAHTPLPTWNVSLVLLALAAAAALVARARATPRR